MSCLSNGAVFTRRPLTEADLAAVDGILAERATRLVRTRKGWAWTYSRGDVALDVRIESLGDVLWDCEDDLLALGMLPQEGQRRVFLCAGRCGDDEDQEIAHLLRRIAEAVDGLSIGPRRSH